MFSPHARCPLRKIRIVAHNTAHDAESERSEKDAPVRSCLPLSSGVTAVHTCARASNGLFRKYPGHRRPGGGYGDDRRADASPLADMPAYTSHCEGRLKRRYESLPCLPADHVRCRHAPRTPGHGLQAERFRSCVAAAASARPGIASKKWLRALSIHVSCGICSKRRLWRQQLKHEKYSNDVHAWRIDAVRCLKHGQRTAMWRTRESGTGIRAVSARQPSIAPRTRATSNRCLDQNLLLPRNFRQHALDDCGNRS